MTAADTVTGHCSCTRAGPWDSYLDSSKAAGRVGSDQSYNTLLCSSRQLRLWVAGWQPKKLYQAFIDDSHEKLRAEFELWKQRWHAAVEPSKTALDAYMYTACNASMYPNLSILLQVLVSLPVTTATAERSFPLSNG